MKTLINLWYSHFPNYKIIQKKENLKHHRMGGKIAMKQAKKYWKNIQK